MARFDLSDAEWGFIRPLLPDRPRGFARVDDCLELELEPLNAHA